MFSEEASCSDCKLEIIQIRWTQLLLNWINKCVNVKRKADQIDMKTLAHVIKKYKEEISIDATDKALLSPDNLGLFIKYKFPIARLENLSEEKDVPKKLYVMASILLFYCCVHSQSGKVDADICSHLDAEEQEMILKFCEVLTECEVTVNNIDIAIEEACSISKSLKKMMKKLKSKAKKNDPKVTSEMESINSMASRTNSIGVEEKKKVTIQENTDFNTKETPVIKFKSSITVLPSVVTDTSSYSKSSADHLSETSDYNVNNKMKKVHEAIEVVACNSKDVAIDPAEVNCLQEDSGDQKRNCQPECACTRCSKSGPCCGDPGISMEKCKEKTKKRVRVKEFKEIPPKRRTYLSNWKLYLMLFIGIILAVLLVITIYMIPKKIPEKVIKRRWSDETVTFYPNWAWQCQNKLCLKVYQPTQTTGIHNSLGRCILLCMGPQLWPYPIGYTYFSKTLVALATNKLEYKFQTIQSDTLHQYLAEAFKFFIEDLIILEKSNAKPKNLTSGLTLMKMNIQIEVDSDTDPRLRTNTDETYSLKMESKINQLLIKISAASFCGVRHGLETLSQLIVLDKTSGYLITVSSATIKDSPSYKYRGLMIDTGRNYIPVSDLLRTIDGMATCKLNTFHWRISDVTSFPLQLSKFPELSEFGPYDAAMVYTKEDVKSVVDRAGFRGIRVLMEVAMPGPVGRPWSWSPQASCTRKIDNYTCDNVLCLRLQMKDALFDILQIIYSEILDLTKVDDIFHLSGGLFSISNCFYLLDDREGFLEKALDRLKLASGGFLPKLPIIWYTAHLTRDLEAKSWDRFGVQLNDWNTDTPFQSLNKFKVIHSSKWDLSCQMKKKRCTKYRSWQEMYSWKTWRNVEVFTVEGGEAILWTDLVDSGNLDHHLWPRTAAVAERLWSDVVANSTVTPSVYARLDSHRWRMLLRGIEVQPIWPAWCSFNPSKCLEKIK